MALFLDLTHLSTCMSASSNAFSNMLLMPAYKSVKNCMSSSSCYLILLFFSFVAFYCTESAIKSPFWMLNAAEVLRTLPEAIEPWRLSNSSCCDLAPPDDDQSSSNNGCMCNQP